MRSQSLPMRTIFFIIIMIIVIAVVIIFFLVYKGNLGSQTSTSIIVAKNLTQNATGM